MTTSKGVYLILFVLACCGCKTHSTKHDFYSYSKSFDLWRLPILEPYELISPSNPGGWFLLLEDPQFKNPDFLKREKDSRSQILKRSAYLIV